MASGLENEYVTLHEIVKAAKIRLNANIWDYLIGGTETETTLRRNRMELDSIAFKPRVLRDVSKIDPSSEIFGKKLRIPVLLAPVGSLESFEPGGGITVAKGAGAGGVGMLISSVTTLRLEDIVKGGAGPKIYQLYVRGDTDWIRDILVTNQSNFTKSRILERAKVLLGEGLLTSEGEFHTRQRRLVQPAFHRDRLVRYAADMVACTEKTSRLWVTAGGGSSLDIHREMTRLTLAIVGRTLFSADVSSEADEIGAAMTQIFALFDTLLMPFADWLQKLPIPPVRRF